MVNRLRYSNTQGKYGILRNQMYSFSIASDIKKLLLFVFKPKSNDIFLISLL